MTAMVAIVAVAWLLQSVNFSLPVGIVKDVSVPFPCQSNGCGCKDATQCWSSCGCFSDQEKIAWAKENKVQPPEWFLEDIASNARPTEGACGGCCCCGHKSATPAKETLVADSDPTPVGVAETVPPTTRIGYLNLKQQRNCQGQYGPEYGGWYFIAYDLEPLPAISLSPVCIRDACPAPLASPLPETPPPQRV